MGIEQPLLQMEEAHKRDTVKEKLAAALIYKQAQLEETLKLKGKG